MTLKEEIEDVFKKYLRAIFSKDFESMYSVLYEDDVQKFRDTMIEFAYKMDEFGESQDFIKKLGFKSISELEQLSLFEFMASIFKLISREVGEENLNKILSETTITNIDEVEYYSLVSYQYPINVFDEWELHKGEVQMIKSQNEWKLFFKSGLEAGLSRFQEDIDRYYYRKERDNLNNFQFEGDLSKFSIIGYKDFSSGKVVFEPRFRDAGEFSDGLAFVQIMKKYGYINIKGEIAIKPQFLDAKDFSQKLAGVKKAISDGKAHWGFIDKKGKEKIPFQYDETSNFSQGLCAVKKSGKWGFINKKGELLIPFKFDTAEDFDDGTAYVSIYNEDGEEVEFVLDKKGNIKEME